MAETGRWLPKLVSKASRQGRAAGDRMDGGEGVEIMPCGAGTDRPFGGDGCHALAMRDENPCGGDHAVHGRGGGDHGRPDLSGSDWSRVWVRWSGEGRKTGVVTCLTGPARSAAG